MRIAPQARVDGSYRPMIEAFSHLAVTFTGGQVLEADLEGDLFELEDQRNWTDGSFKTYPTPLARSKTRRMRAGEHVRQRVVLRLKGARAAHDSSRMCPASPWAVGPDEWFRRSG